MKRYYTVKEVSKLLGVSTNTVYKYLDEGSLPSKRFGKGRFKIPAKDLAPFLDQNSSDVQQIKLQTFVPLAVVENTPPQSELVKKETPEPVLSTPEIKTVDNNLETANDIVSFGVRDILFFRIFKGIVFLGLGLIYLFSRSNLFSFDIPFIKNSQEVFLGLLPFGLILSGLLNLGEVISSKKFRPYHFAIDLFTVFVLAYFSFLAAVASEFGLFAFAASFMCIALGHLVSGVRGNMESSGFYNTFLRYCLYLSLIGGLIVTIYPETFSLWTVSLYVIRNRGYFAFVWFLLTCVPLIYFLAPANKKTIFNLPYLVLASGVGVIFATNLTFIGRWDVSYFVFLTAIFGFFLAWWTEEKRELNLSSVWIVLLSFLWISVTLVFGLYSLNISRNQTKSGIKASLEGSSEIVASAINANFDKRGSILASVAGKTETKEVLVAKDVDRAVAVAKDIYEKVGSSERVMLYSPDGIVLGVYPRDSLFQGTDFSSRGYFSKTLESYRSYISPIFKDVREDASVIQTEPIFEKNQFVGMIGIGLDLRKLGEELRIATAFDYDYRATDTEGNIVFDSDSDKIGSKFENIETPYTKENVIKTAQSADIPNWELTLSSDISQIISKSSSLNITLSILLVINSLFSVSAAVIAASKRKQTETLDLERNILVSESPRFV